MSFCQYPFNPSELYRRTKPGTAPETICGARTFPAMDEPEVVVVKTGMGPDGAVYAYQPTGRAVARAQDDPYCPGHGGSPPPPPPAVTVAELEQAYSAYQELMSRYQAQPGTALALGTSQAPQLPAALAPVTLPAAITAAPVATPAAPTAEDVAAARQKVADLIGRAGQEGVTKP